MASSKRLLELAVAGLEAERKRIDEEILELKAQLDGRGVSSAEARAASPASKEARKKTGKRKLSAKARKAISEAQKRRWAERKKVAG